MGEAGWADLEACRGRALWQTSDSGEEPPLLLVGRGEFNFCPTASCPLPLKGGREDSVLTRIMGTAAIFTIKFAAPGCQEKTE